jgi:uncharacterized protein YbbC (DUF1343 family)
VGGSVDEVLKKTNNHIRLFYLLQAYKFFPDKSNFFIKPKKLLIQPEDYGFNKLAGNAELMQHIKAGRSEVDIRKSWQPKLQEFKKIRKKYLLYTDFE